MFRIFWEFYNKRIDGQKGKAQNDDFDEVQKLCLEFHFNWLKILFQQQRSKNVSWQFEWAQLNDCEIISSNKIVMKASRQKSEFFVFTVFSSICSNIRHFASVFGKIVLLMDIMTAFNGKVIFLKVSWTETKVTRFLWVNVVISVFTETAEIADNYCVSGNNC